MLGHVFICLCDRVSLVCHLQIIVEVHDDFQLSTKSVFLSLPELELHESEIPYMWSSSITEPFGDRGIILTKGGATLSCPPSSLAPNTEISMTVFEVDSDKPVMDKVYLSPLVVIETQPHTRPNDPLRLFLPLQTHHGWPVRVRASHTAFLDSPEWEILPQEDVTKCDGGVEVLVRQFSEFQADCSEVEIIIKGKMMYFSISSCDIGCGKQRLWVACSTLVEYCLEIPSGFQIAHDKTQTERCAVRVYPTTDLAVTIESSDGSILQCGHSEVDDKHKDERLHTDFAIKPRKSPSAPEEASVEQDDEESDGRTGETYQWAIGPAGSSSVGLGSLLTRCRTCAEKESGQRPKHKHMKSRTLDFKVYFTGVSIFVKVVHA